jgi:uncharacterized protein YehS (DUF1456 family)
MKEINKDIFKEVEEEVNSALNDSKGVASHQRRLAFVLSLGTVCLIEEYLEKLNIFKVGAKINHEWLKKKKENAKKFIERQITCPIEEVRDLDNLLDIAYGIEEERNLQAYGKKISEEILMKKINLFLELKKKVENA